MTSTKKTPALTLTDMAALLARGARIHCGKASLEVRWVPVYSLRRLGQDAVGQERRFVMEGPSGHHSLLVDATDLERLNAHWTGFCADYRNAYATA